MSPTSPDEPPPATRSDAALVADVLAGVSGAFEQLVERYERPARASCFAILRDWHLAEDAAQDGFVTAYRGLRSLRDPASFGPWLLTIMRHRAMRVAGSRRPVASLHDRPEPHDITAAAGRDADETEHLIAAIGKLPEHERAAVMLRYFDGHDVATIAAISGKPVGTITKQLSRAHRRLAKLLRGRDGGTP